MKDAYPAIKECAKILRELGNDCTAPAFYICLNNYVLERDNRSPQDCLVILLKEIEKRQKEEDSTEQEMIFKIHGGISFDKYHCSFNRETFFVFPYGTSQETIRKAKWDNDNEMESLFPCSKYFSLLSYEIQIPDFPDTFDLGMFGINLGQFEELCEKAKLPFSSYYRKNELLGIWDIDENGKEYKKDMKEMKRLLKKERDISI